MAFYMKSSPLKAIGDVKDGIIKRALTGQRVSNSVETSSKRQSKGIYTKAELASKSSNEDLSNEFTASLSKPGNKAKNPFVNGVDTSVKTTTPTKPTKSPDVTKAKTLKPAKLEKVKVSEKSVKLAESSPKIKTEMAKPVAEVKKSGTTKQEARLSKTKKKAAAVKSDYNSGSRGQVEGKAARAKYDRLNKRADRIQKRITKKNK
jgi:hypothetical protein